MELNRELIEKTLEHCATNLTCCNRCPLREVVEVKSSDSCKRIMLQASLTLVKSQEQKIKELSEENERLRAEKKRGYWFTDYARQPMVVCSNCNLSNNYNRSKYCPHCGARMDGK